MTTDEGGAIEETGVFDLDSSRPDLTHVSANAGQFCT